MQLSVEQVSKETFAALKGWGNMKSVCWTLLVYILKDSSVSHFGEGKGK